MTPAEQRDSRHKERKAREKLQVERDTEARLRREETAARQAAEARIAELERQLLEK